MSALRGRRARRAVLRRLLVVVLLVLAAEHRPRRKPSAWQPRAAAGARPDAPRASSRLAARQARGRGRRAPGRGLAVPTSDTHHARAPQRRPPRSAVLGLRAPHPAPRAAPAAPPPRSQRAPARARRLPGLRLLRSASSCTSTPAAGRRGAPLRPRARARERGAGTARARPRAAGARPGLACRCPGSARALRWGAGVSLEQLGH